MTVDYKAERLARLRARAADRPAHMRYVEEVIRMTEDGTVETDWPSEASRKGVSQKYQAAIDDDVAAAYANRSGFGEYEELRVRDARAANERQRTQRRTESSLEHLLRIGS